MNPKILLGSIALGISFASSGQTFDPKTYVPSGVGHFIYAGPTNGSSDAVTIKWKYGFQFTVDTKPITEIRLTCAPISGSTFTVNREALNVNAKGVAYWEGASMALTKKNAPWIFSSSATQTVCEATIGREGMADVVERVPVRFEGPAKAALRQSLETVYKYNH